MILKVGTTAVLYSQYLFNNKLACIFTTVEKPNFYFPNLWKVSNFFW